MIAWVTNDTYLTLTSVLGAGLVWVAVALFKTRERVARLEGLLESRRGKE